MVEIVNKTAFMVFSEYDYGIVYNQTIYATDLALGLVKWKYKVPAEQLMSQSYDRNGKPEMSINDGKIYAAGLNKSFVLDGATGKHIQDYSTGGLAKQLKKISIWAKRGVWLYDIGKNCFTSHTPYIYNIWRLRFWVLSKITNPSEATDTELYWRRR